MGGGALSKPHDISGLITWSKREEWRGTLAELLDRHSVKLALQHVTMRWLP
jgi:hypothetical protein